MKKSVLLQCRQRARFAAARLVRTLPPEVGKRNSYAHKSGRGK